MSADSAKKSLKWIGSCLRPQQVNDKTKLETFMGYIQDITCSTQPDDREKIQWISMHHHEIESEIPENDSASNLILIIGYTNGVQMWIVQENGDAVEIFSLRQGPIKHLKLLPMGKKMNDKFLKKMPVIIFSDGSSAGKPFCSAKFVSLKSGDEVFNLPFNHQIVDIQLNERIIVFAFNEKITVFNFYSLNEMFSIISCYPCSTINSNPISIGSRWLAYADKMLVLKHQSGGGVCVDNSQSYAATIMSAAQSVQKGITAIRDTLSGSSTSQQGSLTANSPTNKKISQQDSNMKPGVVTIVDTMAVTEKLVCVQEDWTGDSLVAHFVAHLTDPVVSLTFDPTGTLLLTADSQGRSFNLFKIMAHPFSSSQATVYHLYILKRGDTAAQIQSVSFTSDSRWVAVTTLRSTTHIFPITPYGGQITKRTHMSQRVVSRTSRFHRSAGLEDIEIGSFGGKDSPVFFNQAGTSPSSSPGSRRSFSFQQNLLHNNINNVCLPPYPIATVVSPIAQIRMNPLPVSTSSIKYNCNTALRGNSALSDNLCVASCFAMVRINRSGKHEDYIAEDAYSHVESLFVMSYDGNLTEYNLNVRPKHSPDKITDDSQIEADAVPFLKWPISRFLFNAEIRFPLSSACPIFKIFDCKKNDSSGIQSTSESSDSNDEEWLAEVEMSTYAGPYRRLWMGPQFSIKTVSPRPSIEADARAPSIMAASTSSLEDDDVIDDDFGGTNIRKSKPMMIARPSRSRGSLSSDAASTASTPQQTYIETMETGSYTCHSPAFHWANETADEHVRASLADAMNESQRNR